MATPEYWQSRRQRKKVEMLERRFDTSYSKLLDALSVYSVVRHPSSLQPIKGTPSPQLFFSLLSLKDVTRSEDACQIGSVHTPIKIYRYQTRCIVQYEGTVMLPSFHARFLWLAHCVAGQFLFVAIAGCDNGETGVPRNGKAGTERLVNVENANSVTTKASALSMTDAPALWSRAPATVAPAGGLDTQDSPLSAPSALPMPVRAENLPDATSDEPADNLVAIDRPGNLVGKSYVRPHAADTIAPRQVGAR